MLPLGYKWLICKYDHSILKRFLRITSYCCRHPIFQCLSFHQRMLNQVWFRTCISWVRTHYQNIGDIYAGEMTKVFRTWTWTGLEDKTNIIQIESSKSSMTLKWQISFSDHHVCWPVINISIVSVAYYLHPIQQMEYFSICTWSIHGLK